MGTGQHILDKYQAFVKDITSKGFEYLASGSFRETYVRNNIVIKVPMNTDGFNDNLIEARAWKKYRSQPTNLGMFLAPCRLLPNGSLMMVKVNDELSEDDYENTDWVKIIDGGQVGYYKGKIVAYDYALDLKERKAWEKEIKIQSEFFQNNYYHSHDHLLED